MSEAEKVRWYICVGCHGGDVERRYSLPEDCYPKCVDLADYEASERRVGELEDLLRRIVAADDQALAELATIGMDLPAESIALTEEARALLSAQGEKS